MTESRAALEVTTRLMYMNVYDVNGTIKVGWGLHGDRQTSELVMLQHLDTLRAAGYKNLSGAIVPVRMRAEITDVQPIQAFRLDGRGLVRTKLDESMFAHTTAPTATEPEHPTDPTTPPFDPDHTPTAATVEAMAAAHAHVPSFD